MPATAFGNSVYGSVSDRSGLEYFSFTKNKLFNSLFSSGGKTFSIRPDFIPKVPFGSSYNVFQGSNSLGNIGQNPAFSSVSIGGGLNTKLGIAIGTSMKTAGGF